MDAQSPPAAIPGPEHYGKKYFSKRFARLASYRMQAWLTVEALKGVASPTVLLVGKGDGIVESILARCGVKVTTLDLQADLEPDIVASVESIPVEDGAFDCAVCCQVLEHLPFEKFRECLAELRRVVTGGGAVPLEPDVTGGTPVPRNSDPDVTGGMPVPRNSEPDVTGGMPVPRNSEPDVTGGTPVPRTRGVLVLSLPDQRPFFSLGLALTNTQRHLSLSLPKLPARPIPADRFAKMGHHWEIGYRGTPVGRVKREIAAAGWRLERMPGGGRVRELPWHTFFVCR